MDDTITKANSHIYNNIGNSNQEKTQKCKDCKSFRPGNICKRLKGIVNPELRCGYFKTKGGE